METGTRWRPGERATGSDPGLPLPVLPHFPAVRAYASLRQAVAKPGFRHAADVLRPHTANDEGFLVLDGLWFPGRGHASWLRADVAFVTRAGDRWRASGDPRATDAVALLRTLSTVVSTGPMRLRQLVLYELCCLLTDRDGGPTPAAAEELGVHRSEAGPLAAAVATDFPGPGPERQAAEEIVDVWRAGRLRRAAQLATDLPGTPTDHMLAGLLTSLRARTASVDQLLADADQLLGQDRPRAAAAAWLTVLRQAVDEPRARTGLLRAAARAADLPGTESGTAESGESVRVTELRIAVRQGTARLTWTLSPAAASCNTEARKAPETTKVQYRVVRFPDGAPGDAVEISAPGTSHTVVDAAAPTGKRLRYAVIPLLRGRVAGIPRATAPVLLTPEVERPQPRPVPDGIRLDWQPHPSAAQIRAVRLPDTAAADGCSAPAVPCGRNGLVDRPLSPGEHRYLISSGYPGNDGTLLWSSGVLVSAQAKEWPSPVMDLTVRRIGEHGRVSISWRSPARGQGQLVPWKAAPVDPGEDVSALLGRLPVGTGLLEPADSDTSTDTADGASLSTVELQPSAGTVTRVTAVSLLDDRAVSGPSVVIEAPGTVAGLSARRLAPDTAEVHFNWPDPAVLVLVRWERKNGGHEERRIPRSRHRTVPVEIPVPRQACRITVTPVARPDAVVVASGTAEATLPAAPSPPAVLARLAQDWWRQCHQWCQQRWATTPRVGRPSRR